MSAHDLTTYYFILAMLNLLIFTCTGIQIGQLLAVTREGRRLERQEQERENAIEEQHVIEVRQAAERKVRHLADEAEQRRIEQVESDAEVEAWQSFFSDQTAPCPRSRHISIWDDESRLAIDACRAQHEELCVGHATTRWPEDTYRNIASNIFWNAKAKIEDGLRLVETHSPTGGAAHDASVDPFTRNAIKNRALQRDERDPREDFDGALPQFARISDIYARRVNTGAVRRGRRCPPLS